MGWFCGYTPLEIIHAAGLLPVRISGHSEPIRKADSLMHPNLCHYVKSCLDVGLSGESGPLAGTVFVNSCDAMRRLHDVWRNFVPNDFSTIIDLPRGNPEPGIDYFKTELESLVSAIENHFKTKITEESLKSSIGTYNEARALFGRVNALRKEHPPRVTAAEISKLAYSFFSEPPKNWIESTTALLSEREARTPVPPATTKPRAVITGSPMHNPDTMAFFEDCGLDIVYDDLCTGNRFFAHAVPDTGDPLLDLAGAYMRKPPCARMMRIEERAERLIALAREFAANGVVHIALKFCDTTLYDAPPLKSALAQAGIKTLFIESDGTLGGFGQLKTRIQAFAEILSAP